MNYKKTNYWLNLQSRKQYHLNCMKHYKDLMKSATTESGKAAFYKTYLKHKRKLRMIQGFMCDIEMYDE